MSDALRADEFDLMLSTLRYVLGAGQAKNGEKASDHYNAIINSIASRAERTEDADVRLACAAVKRAALAQPPAPTAQAAPVNGIKATMFHDEGAIAQCQGCKRYSLDPNTLHQSDSKQPVCECGKQHYWSGSFVKPGPDAKWHGKEPVAQPVQQPGAEPDMRHPKIQALIGSKARCQIELMLVEQLIEDPDCDLTSMDMEYWGPMHDRLKEALTKAAPAQRQPLSDDTKTQMWRAAYRDDPRRLGSFEWYAQGVEDAEAAHGITAAPAAQKGEKL